MGTFELDRHAHVLGLRRQPRQAEPQSIGAELFDHVDRIDAVPFRLRHRLAVSIEDLRMDEDLVERNFAHVVQPHQHHTGDPQGDDIAAGDKDTRGIEVLEFGCAFRPTECRVRPERRAEPGIEHVFFATEAECLETLFQFLRCFADADVDHHVLLAHARIGQLDLPGYLAGLHSRVLS